VNRIRPWLYVGKYRDTLDGKRLVEAGIQAVLQLAAPFEYPGLDVLYLPVDDGVPIDPMLFERGIAFIRAHCPDRPLLIACGAGVSRSVSFAIVALRELEQRSLLEAYEIVKTCHPDAMPHPTLWNSLCEHYGEEVPFVELLRYDAP
jgi:protein-tyrosine phosphatase